MTGSGRKFKGWVAVAHTRVGADWCFTWAAWGEKPTAKPWKTPWCVGLVKQFDGEVVIEDAQERALADARAAIPECARSARVEDGFALAARREAAGEEPRYRPLVAPKMVAEAYYAVLELSDEKPPALPITATLAKVPKSTSAIELRGGVGKRTFWACWVTCGKPTLVPWSPPDDLGIVIGPGSLEQAIGAADEACRRVRGERVYAYSVGTAFAARAYTDGARCTRSARVDHSILGKEALAWLELPETATESEVRRAWGKKVRDEKLHPDQAEGEEAKEKAQEAFKAIEAKKRAAIAYLEGLARATGKVTAFTQEKIEKQVAKKKRAAEKKAKKEAGQSA